MNLAQALLRTPKNIRITPADHEPEHKASRAGRPAGSRALPGEYVQAAGLIYIIGQVTRPVSWGRIAAWVSAETGRNVTFEGLRMIVLRHAKSRSRAAIAEGHLEVAQYYIICRLHGMKQPWPHIAARVNAVRPTTRHYRRIMLQTLSYIRKMTGGRP